MIPTTDNKRRRTRVAHDVQVVFKPKKRENYRGMLMNVSECGAYLLSAQRMLPHTEFIAYLPLSLCGEERLCMVSGKVVRTEMRVGTTLHGHGLSFDAETAPSSRRLLRDFVSFKTTGELPAGESDFEPPSKASKPAKIPLRRRSFARPSFRTSWGLFYVAGAALVVLALVVSNLIFRSASEGIVASRISQVIPLRQTVVKGSELRAQLQSRWFEETSPSQRNAQLRDLGIQLQKEKIEQATLLDSEGKEVVVVTAGLTSTGEPQVKWWR